VDGARHRDACAGRLGRVRVQIRPGLHTAWRTPASVQIGLDPEHGTVLDGLNAGDRGLVQALAAGVDEAFMAGAGDGASRARRLVGLLARAGVVVRTRAGRERLAELGDDAPRLAPDAAVWGLARPGGMDGWEVIAARRHRVVEIHGGGRVALALGTLLSAAGVGNVRAVDGGVVRAGDVAPGAARPADVGLAPADALAAAAAAVGPRTPPTADRTDRLPEAPDLVVLVGVGVADSVAADGLLAGEVPHLAVVVRERDVVVGPLVLPGSGPCLRCLDLHRTDRDPAWPRVLAQVLARPAAPAAETVSSLLGASLAALQVLGHLDAGPPPAAHGATLEIGLPDGLVARRPWPAHPACGCT
jgi:hypothetical protein